MTTERVWKVKPGPKTTKRGKARLADNLEKRAAVSKATNGRSVKRSKYRAQGLFVGEVWCASKAEAERYRQLLRMVEQGVIEELETQPKLPCLVNGARVTTYIADFRYHVLDDRGVRLRQVVEDVKGVQTSLYKLKKKLVQALHRIEIHEIPAAKVPRYEGRPGDEPLT